jgi:hypothetical protein
MPDYFAWVNLPICIDWLIGQSNQYTENNYLMKLSMHEMEGILKYVTGLHLLCCKISCRWHKNSTYMLSHIFFFFFSVKLYALRIWRQTSIETLQGTSMYFKSFMKCKGLTFTCMLKKQLIRLLSNSWKAFHWLKANFLALKGLHNNIPYLKTTKFHVVYNAKFSFYTTWNFNVRGADVKFSYLSKGKFHDI